MRPDHVHKDVILFLVSLHTTSSPVDLVFIVTEQ